MPTLSTPTLTLGNTVNNKRNVTVAGSVSFDAGDVGKTYRLEIKLFGDDFSGDKLPSGDSVFDDELYTYSFAGVSPLPRPYKVLAVAAAGTVNYSEVRTIDVGLLDEDGGVIMTNTDPPLPIPRKDEVYARVTVSGAPVSVNSPTIDASFGI
ncbi:hypothetical protein [Methylibium rhizosphaerae]|jgi:hypothetical protein|uniref:hypothetical protein n=1 Tax=Methylibium rhizosphaerae TaxID=2570323 RepID=UPI00112C2D9B|nr:hypothetical protein [Methylibium rhizosphaerae]